MLGCPCRIDFSRAEARLIASRGSATSMSFFKSSSSRLYRGKLKVVVSRNDPEMMSLAKVPPQN